MSHASNNSIFPMLLADMCVDAKDGSMISLDPSTKIVSDL